MYWYNHKGSGKSLDELVKILKAKGFTHIEAHRAIGAASSGELRNIENW